MHSPTDQAFLGKTIPHVDALLHAMKGIDDHHPLANLLFETAVSVREILNCWGLARLHSVALESLDAREFSSHACCLLLGLLLASGQSTITCPCLHFAGSKRIRKSIDAQIAVRCV